MANEIKILNFIKSLLTFDNPLMSIQDVLKWIEYKILNKSKYQRNKVFRT